MFVEEKTDTNSQELKTKRESLGLSLADIFQRTRISVANLQAMENNDFHLLPTAAYSKNFIKTYARFLDIDSEPILVKYEDYLNSRKRVQKLLPEDVSKRTLLLTKIASRRLYWGIAAALIVISAVAWFISKQYQSSSDIINSTGSITADVQKNREQTVNPPVNATVPISQQIKVATELAPKEINKQSEAKEQSIPVAGENNLAKNVQTAVNSEEGNLLIISAIEETWIRIKADQNHSSQILLKPGQKIERKAASFEMDIGNAGGIKIQFKGKNIENLGKSGQVTHLRLP